MTHGSLFTGIGGFDLAAHWAGIPTLWQCEKDPYCRAVLAKHFPNTPCYEDIRAIQHPPAVDIISGGFPCQPFSAAGKRAGANDERYLWPEMCRVIAQVRPRWVVGENVAGLVSMAEFDRTCADLEAQGYEVWPVVIPAAAVGAPHIRYRVWILAHA